MLQNGHPMHSNIRRHRSILPSFELARRLALLACLSPGVRRSAVAQTPFPPDSSVQAIVAEMVTTGRTKGLVVGILESSGGRRFFTAAAVGAAPRPPLDAHSVFEIGSIGKVFTSALLADMAVRGEVRLDEPVAKLLPPSVAVPSRGGKAITLADLATHYSGLPRVPTNLSPDSFGNPFAGYSLERLYAFLSGHRLTRDPGAAYEYSNLGMGLLGEALARRLGTSYGVAMERRILTPLGMRETAIALTPSMQARLVQGHDRFGDVAGTWDIGAFAGAGALRSTAWDMLTFAAAHLSVLRGSPYDGMRDSRTARRPAGRGLTARDGDSIALNWFVSHRGERTIVWHNGGTGGYRSFLGLDPAAKRGVVVLTNMGGHGADDLGFHLLDSTMPLEPPPVSFTVLAAFREGGTEHAIARYRNLKATEPRRWSFTSDELNTVGYWLLEHGHAAAAVAVFRVNVEMYPAESNPYDSLGEALLAVGDTVGAMANYQRSIEINPLNADGVSTLERLRRARSEKSRLRHTPP